ncbi:MAG: hypothetical protein ACOX6T_08415 [Myxococcales bacterium]|jgi:type IV pilus assembly protein PilY1
MKTLFSNLRRSTKACRQRPLLLGLVTFSVLLVPALLLAGPGDGGGGNDKLPPKAACCIGPLTLGDSLINFSEGGDKDFFESKTGPASVMFLLGNNSGMQDFAIPLPNISSRGCSDSNLVSAMSWFDIKSTDPAKNGSVVFDPDPELGSNNFFNPALYYRVGRTQMIRGNGASDSLASNFRSTRGYSTAADACDSFSGTNETTCESCLTDKGWYRYSDSLWIVSGGVLNLRPPKFVTARKVLKDVVDSLSNVRMGLATLDLDDGGAYDPAYVWTNPTSGVFGLAPTCAQSFPVLDDQALADARADLKTNLNLVQFTGSERSFGEALTAVGGYFANKGLWTEWFATDKVPKHNGYPNGRGWSGGAAEWISPSGTLDGVGQPWERDDNKSFCWACQSSAVIIVSDGTPYADNTVPVTQMLKLLVDKGAKHPDGSPLTFGPNTSDPGGVNYCDLFEPHHTKEQCDEGDNPRGPDATNRNFMDDVTFFLSHADLRPDSEYAGKQSVRTYTIGFTDSSPMLRSMALAGGGRFFRADNATELKDSIVSAVEDLKSGATSFASTAVSNVQAGGMQTSVYIPRFIPRVGRPFEGHLYRYRYYSEFTEGCSPALAASDDGDPTDINEDGDCDDVYFLDKPSSWTLTAGQLPPANAFTKLNVVQENRTGEWVKVATAQPDSEGKLVGGEPAKPFWDAAEALESKSASKSCEDGGRCIFTIIDRTKDGNFTVDDNPPVEFHQDNEALLRPYLLSGGASACKEILAALPVPDTYDGSEAKQQRCSETIIDFIRGVDVFDYDSDGNATEDRPCQDNPTKSCKLGDIFHSSPIVVDPPVHPLVCTLGLHPQCLMTLYAHTSDFAPVDEKVCAEGSGKPCYEATEMVPAANPAAGTYGAYEQYMNAQKHRDRFILVGANDGMLHAFLAGKHITGKEFDMLGDDIFDLGTGEEMWAFIPPDLLSKLARSALKHEFFVDGTPMVRDVWVDGSGENNTVDGKKQADEYHTVAMISERGGGQRYMALDVTDPWGMKNAGLGTSTTYKPFLWMYPNACDSEAYNFGQSWMNFAPKPPSIGPVRLKNDSRARGWDERWVTFLNGGYSNDLLRGRGVYLVDIWTGERLWSFVAEMEDSNSNSGGGNSGGGGGGGGRSYESSVRDMLAPVAAAPAMLDVGAMQSIKADQDGFFDTVVVGDLGGQVWVFRMYEPGNKPADGEITNWFGARALEIDRADDDKGSDRKLGQKTPFFNIASNTIQTETGWLRTFLGTGDKQNIRDKETSACGLDNLLACTRLGCTVKIDTKIKVDGYELTQSIHYDNGTVKNSRAKPKEKKPSDTCSAAEMSIAKLDVHCNAGHGDTVENNWFEKQSQSVTMSCDVKSGTWSCDMSSAWDIHDHGELDVSEDGLAKLPHNRYYGFFSYGGEERVFSDKTSALAFDDLRLTDRSTYTPSEPCTAETCILTDVTIPESDFETTTIDGKTVRYVPAAKLKRANPLGPGWFIEYANLDEKTAAGSSILVGTVFWPTLVPPEGEQEACGPALTGDVGRSWQADYLTGAPDTAESFKIPEGFIQAKSRAVVAPPPEPASVISLSKTGAVSYGIIVTDPGAPPVAETLRTQRDLTSEIYWLEVPRNLHECRHVNKNACD